MRPHSDDAEPRRTAPDPAHARVVRRVAIAAAVAWTLLAIAAFAAGDPAGAARSAGVLAAVVAAVALARWLPFRYAVPALLLAWALGLAVATIVVGLVWPGAGEAARVALFTGNPNVLGAALVTAMAAWAAVAPRRRWVWWVWPVVALAVLYTGSRTSGGGLLAAGVAWFVVQTVRGRPKLLLAPVLVLAALAIAAFAWQRGVVELTPNLLAAPSDLAAPAWRSLAERIEISDDAAPGPFEGTRAQRLVATAEADRFHLVHQSIGRSETGVPYVASIYLRAETTQRVVLTSHLARVTCEADATWRRCVTPVGYGDDYAQRQLHLRATERGGSVDVYVFGAQYERGVEATAFLDLRPDWLPQSMVNRYDLRRVTFLPENRLVAWRAGLDIAREHPLFGLGLEASREAFRARTPEPVTYAHNLAIQFPAVHGLVGTLGAVVFLIALGSVLGPAGWARLTPLLVGTALLNTWDVTLFEWPVFVTVALAVAWALGADGAPAPGRMRRPPRPRPPVRSPPAPP